MKTLTFTEKYALIGTTQAAAYEGIFITAVKTTGIFCRPVCRARKPKVENTVFYHTAQEALQHGFRPCKLCKPMEKMGETPQYIQHLIAELHANPYQRIKDADLRQRNISPSKIRRWFNTHHQMTFQAYQRLLRINVAFEKLGKGNTVTDSALDSGYESLSGFTESYRAVFGGAATTAKVKNTIQIVRFTTVLGPMFACATKQGVCLLEFTDRRMLETEFTALCSRRNAVILPGENPHLAQVQTELQEYFAGHRKQFEVPLDTPGTDFQKQVWALLQTIPYGETRSYKQQAIALGKPTAVRAVAAANGQNRVGIIIPCHRVIGANGELVGYGGGLYRKQWLLDLEQNKRQNNKPPHYNRENLNEA